MCINSMLRVIILTHASTRQYENPNISVCRKLMIKCNMFNFRNEYKCMETSIYSERTKINKTYASTMEKSFILVTTAFEICRATLAEVAGAIYIYI